MSPQQVSGEEESRRRKRYRLRQVTNRYSSLKGVRLCGRVPAGDYVAVRLREKIAHFSGLILCGSAHACPVCAPKIAAYRAADISARCAAWMAAGNSLLAVTLTFPHDFHMALAPGVDLVLNGWRFVIRGRPWRRARDAGRVAGYMRALEHTHGTHGWHPHLHSLVLVEGDADAATIATVGGTIRAQWETWVTSHGYRRPSGEYGVKVEVVASPAAAGEYLAKGDGGKDPGAELARADMKQGRLGGRSPLQILDDFSRTGDKADLTLWREYEQATYGRKRITESRGLREIMPGPLPEKTDEEIVEEEVGGDVLGVFEPSGWRAVNVVDGLPGRLLDAAEAGGVAAVNDLLAGCGLPGMLPPPSAGVRGPGP